MEIPDELREQLAALVDDYVRQLPKRVEEIDQAFEAVGIKPGDIDAYSQLRLLVHKLAGSGATFGFDEISRSAKDFENRLTAIIESGLLEISGTDKELKEALNGLKDACCVDEVIPELEKMDEQSEQIERSKPVKMHREVILFVREESWEIQDLSDQLGFFGFSAERVVDLRTFRRRIKQNPSQFAIIHTDVFKKSKNAIDSLSVIKTRYGDEVKYIFISEKSDFNTRLDSLRAGSDAFFIVPLDVAKLMDTIDTLCTTEESEPYHVLIVDDDPEQVSYYALVLQQAGMITSVASDPKTVINVLVEAKPELILMDMYMPVCSGTELLTLIRQQEAFVSIPVVFLSIENAEKKKLGRSKRAVMILLQSRRSRSFSSPRYQTGYAEPGNSGTSWSGIL